MNNNFKITIVIISILLSVAVFFCSFLGCNNGSSKQDTYCSFISRDPDPSFSFSYSENCDIIYEPYSDNSLTVEIWDEDDSLLVHIDGERSSYWEKYGSRDPIIMIEDYLTRIENNSGNDDFYVVEQDEILIDEYYAQSVTYNYVDISTNRIEGKKIIFSANGWIWGFWTEYYEKKGQLEKEVFELIINTFKILD